MKKLLIRVSIALVILIILGIIAIGLFLDSAIKKGVETVGPMVTKVAIKLDGVSLSLLSGSGSVKGLVIGNPEGFKTPFAIQVGRASLALQPGSLLSDKIVIRSVEVEAPQVTFETDLRANNLSRILANVQAATGGGGSASAGTAKPAEPAPPTEAKPAKKLQVDLFHISGGTINVSVTALGGKSVTVPLPEIRLTGLGQGPEGITAAELTKRVLQAIEKEAATAAGPAVADLSKEASKLVQDAATKAAGDAASGAAAKATDSIGGLFKKK
jgi:uncharacterized protein involved in outer membrane biogenesis